MTTYRKIKPSSILNSYKGDYEYLLYWLHAAGGVRHGFFSSTEGEKMQECKYTIVDSEEDFRSVPNMETTSIELMSKSLTRESFEYMTSVFKSNRILIVNKDSTTIPVAIKSSKKKTERMIKDFEIKFKIMIQEPDLMNV